MLTVTPKPTPVAYARSGGKTTRFLCFFIRFVFPESAFRFFI
jgi:hypothetical protein